MTPYKNLGGNSGIDSYEIGADSVTVRFEDGWFYLYTAQSAGAANIAEMKALAEAGSGLNGFIKRRVNKLFARKWK